MRFFAAAGTTVDYAIYLHGDSPPGFQITDATLAGASAPLAGRVRCRSAKRFSTPPPAHRSGRLEISSPAGSTSDTINFAGVNSILVEKDMILSRRQQRCQRLVHQPRVLFDCDPRASLDGSLGIGLSGLFTLRRFFKRTSVA